MKKSVVLCAALFVSSALSVPAFAAASGATSQGVQLSAGPGDDYPDVMRLAPNLKVTIHGCTRAWDWCDVEWRGNRGFVPAAALDLRKDSVLMPVSTEGPSAGLPQVDFDLSKYWETHYRQRPWYSDRREWSMRVEQRPASYLAEAN